MSGRGGVVGAVANAVGFAALSGVLLAAAAVVPYGGLGLIALAPLVGRGHAPPGRRLGPTARPLAALVGAPTLLAMPALMAPDPVVRSHWACGTATMAAVVVVPVAAFFAGVLAGAMGLGIAAALPRLVARLAVPLRMATVAVVAVLLVAGTTRWARRPGADAWVTSLPIAATALPDLFEGERARTECETAIARVEVPQGSRTVLLDCGSDGRGLSLGDAASRPLAPGLGRLPVGDGPVTIRTHAALGVLVLSQGGHVVGALDATDGRPVDVRLRAIAGEIAPPGLSLLAAAVALGVGVRQARRAARERAAAITVERAEPAVVDDAGLVVPHGGGDAFRPPGAPLPAGPAVVLGRPHAGPFRGGGDRGTWVLAGEREEHAAAHRARAAAFDLEATAAIAVGAAPLVAAALLGLVL